MIQAIAADGSVHNFPDSTDPAVVDRAMKAYATDNAPSAPVASPRQFPMSQLKSGVLGAFDALPFSRDMISGESGLDAALNGRDPVAAFQARRAQIGDAAAQAQQDNPVSFGVGQVAGSAAIPLGETRTLSQVASKFGLLGALHGAGEGDTPEERLANAGEGGVGAAILGGAFHGLTAPFMKPGSPVISPATQKIAQFDQANIPPSVAAVYPGSAGMTNTTAENYLGGFAPRANLRKSVDATTSAVSDLAAKYGTPSPPDLAGEDVRAGVGAWRDSFKNKAEQVFTRALGPLWKQPAAPTVTEATLQDIMNKVTPGTRTGEFVIPSEIKDLAQRLQDDQGKLSFGDLRELRTKIRTMQKANLISPTIPQANLERLEGALTQDIYNSAQAIGGKPALQQLQAADRYYRQGQTRINSVLKPFLDDAGTGRTAYEKIIDLASDSKKQNTNALMSLRRSLPPDQWNDVAATIIDRMGNVKKGNPAALDPDAFSVDNFVTNYAALSPGGRAALFGGKSALLSELDNLAQVVGMQKTVFAAANKSHSYVNAANAATVAGIAGTGGIGTPLVALGLIGSNVTGDMLTNPKFVRWIANASTRAPVSTAKAVRSLGLLAARDPALAPVYQEAVKRATAAGAFVSGQFPAPESRPTPAGLRLQ